MKANLADVLELLNAGKDAEALAAAEGALLSNPHIPELNYGKAVALGRLGNTSEACAALQALLQVRPQHKKAKALLNELQSTKPSATPNVSRATPLKYLQIHTFYDGYLESFRARFPQHAQASFDQRMQALIDDGFGANHMFAPYLKEQNYDSTLVIANFLDAQTRWCAEHGIAEVSAQHWLHEIARLQVEYYRPEVLYLGDPILFDSNFIRKLEHRPQLVVGWRAAEIPAHTDWSEFDLVLSHLSVCRVRALQLGAKHVAHFFPGIPQFIVDEASSQQKEYDVVFCGQWTPQHAGRNRLITVVAEAAEKYRFSFGLFLGSHHFELPPIVAKYQQPARWGLDMFRALRSGRIVLNAEIDLANKEAGNSRLFEGTAVGSCLLTEYHNNLNHYFEPSKEVVCFQNEQQLVQHIRDLLAHPAERERIAAAGQARCMRDYSMKRQAQRLNLILREQLDRKSGKSAVTDQPKESSMQQASNVDDVMVAVRQGLSALRACNYSEALTYLSAADAQQPNVPEILFGMGLAAASLGQSEQASAYLNRVIALVPSHQPARDMLAKISGQVTASPTTSTTPSNSLQAQAEQVMQLIREGRGPDAMYLAQQMVEQNPTTPGVHFILVCALNVVGRHEEALRAAQRELEINPGHAGAREQYERLSKALGRTKAADLNPEQRSYHSKLPLDVLQSIQKAGHTYAYRGVPMIKNPFDMALYPMLLWNVKPATLIEIGSKDGGSALWFADMLGNFGLNTHVYSLDIVKVAAVSHPRVTFMQANGRELGKTISKEWLDKLPRPILVIEDADHSYETSSAVLNFFHQHLAPGEYIVIEDGIISDLERDPDANSGPHKALKEFIAAHPGEYDMDASYCDMFGYNFTWCTNGFLRKKRYALNSTVPSAQVREFNTLDPATRGATSQMSQNERFQLYSVLRNLLPVEQGVTRCIEVGSFAGASLALTHATLEAAGRKPNLIAVEPSGEPEFYETLKRLGDAVTHVKALSHQAAPALAQHLAQQGALADFIFIDGDHSYEGVRQDAIDYYALLKPGGVMLFHDYLPALNDQNREAIFFHHGGKEPGIRRACQEVMEQQFGCEVLNLELLYPQDPTQTQPHLPVIPGVFSTLRAYRKSLR